MAKTRAKAFYLVSSVLLCVMPVLGQNESGLGGTITDSSGAVLPNVSVTLTSQQQGTVRVAQTNASGLYNFTFLPQGSYTITISAAGFNTLTQNNIELAVAQNVRQDFKLQVGTISDNITVSAS